MATGGGDLTLNVNLDDNTSQGGSTDPSRDDSTLLQKQLDALLDIARVLDEPSPTPQTQTRVRTDGGSPIVVPGTSLGQPVSETVPLGPDSLNPDPASPTQPPGPSTSIFSRLFRGLSSSVTKLVGMLQPSLHVLASSRTNLHYSILHYKLR